ILTEAELPTITASQVLVRLAENGSRSRLLCRLTSLLKWRRQWERSLWKWMISPDTQDRSEGA
ncbi:MAG TPA: hypothetical protein VFN58_07020, partial [Candidatus Binatia bacterium]|nr:hypothetical protein [Candidatus Binatia bacterium]